MNNLVRAIEKGIFSETTQARLTELEIRKKALTEAIDAEEIKRAIAKHDISIQHFFDEYAHADLTDLTVRDYLLDYFIDKIFVYDDRVIVTIWYGDDKKELTWGDIDFEIKRPRKRRKSSSVSEGGFHHQRDAGPNTLQEHGSVFFMFITKKSIWLHYHKSTSDELF